MKNIKKIAAWHKLEEIVMVRLLLKLEGFVIFLVSLALYRALGFGAAATAVSGAATGALAGGLIGALTNLGVPEEDVRVYESRLREGAVLLAVPAVAGRDPSEIQRIFAEHHAEQIRDDKRPHSRFF